MPKLIAEQEFAYEGVLLHPGDEFDATDRDADLLQRVKRARLYETRDMKADEAPKKAGYNRRDMKARK